MNALQKRIGYVFRDSALLKLAMTHPSLAGKSNNQRLEFLGDAILGAVVTRILYDMYPSEQEGELARRRTALIRGEALAQVARKIKLGEVLHIAESEQLGGGRDNASILEDALEALIGAMYLDGGIAAAETFITEHWKSLAQKIQAPPKDAKTALQEWAQAKGLPLPAYRLLTSTGPAHAPEFTIQVMVHGYDPVEAKAPSKRIAEQAAAEALLKNLKNRS